MCLQSFLQNTYGNGGLQSVIFKMLYLAETRADGKYYSSGSVLFDSETNSVDVRFTSDHGTRKSGFTLDVSTIPCSWTTGYCGPFSTGEVQDVMVAPGEVLEDVIATPTEDDGLYANDVCLDWNIITDEGKVRTVFF